MCMICLYDKSHTPNAIGPFVSAIRLKAKDSSCKPDVVILHSTECRLNRNTMVLYDILPYVIPEPDTSRRYCHSILTLLRLRRLVIEFARGFGVHWHRLHSVFRKIRSSV